MSALGKRRSGRRGQSLVEFSLILIPFLFLLMGVVDLGRGIASNNGVANAAREIARVTSVHPGTTLGNSAETAEVIAVQRKTVLGLSDPAAVISITCTDIGGTPVAGTTCARSNFVRVEVSAPFSVITPLLGMVAPTTLRSVSHVQVTGG